MRSRSNEVNQSQTVIERSYKQQQQHGQQHGQTYTGAGNTHQHNILSPFPDDVSPLPPLERSLYFHNPLPTPSSPTVLPNIFYSTILEKVKCILGSAGLEFCRFAQPQSRPRDPVEPTTTTTTRAAGATGAWRKCWSRRTCCVYNDSKPDTSGSEFTAWIRRPN